jgi:hypothetical protein
MVREVGQTLRYKAAQGSYELAGALYTGHGYRGDLGLLTASPAAGVTGGGAQVYRRTGQSVEAMQAASARQAQSASVGQRQGMSL